MSGGSKNYARLGEQAFQKMDKINAEVFTLTYGSMVQQLIKVWLMVEEYILYFVNSTHTQAHKNKN
jgi:hypothetical protein